MDKTWTILKSEFRRRVWTKSFVLVTLLAPFGLLAFFGLMGAVGFFAAQSTFDSVDDETITADSSEVIAVVDESGRFLPALRAAAGDSLRLVASDAPPDSLRNAVRQGRYRGVLVLPASLLQDSARAVYLTTQTGAGAFEAALAGAASSAALPGADSVQAAALFSAGEAEEPGAWRRALGAAVRHVRLAARGVPPEVVGLLERAVVVGAEALPRTGAVEQAGPGVEAIYSIVGYVMGFVIYFAVLMYGVKVMQGVIEEKQSRVVEVIISSVRPFQLLMGKVLGIGAVGLLQMSAWSLFVIAGTMVVGNVAASFVNVGALGVALPAFPPALLVWFLLFFLGGYLLYASLFAALGSTVEKQQDAQGLNAVIVLLLVLPMSCIGFVVGDPNSTFAVVTSLIPLFSPILMPVRVAVAGVPFWEVALSFVLLMGTFVGAVWLSSRIYRVGILMYGKKPGLAELVRWVRYR